MVVTDRQMAVNNEEAWKELFKYGVFAVEDLKYKKRERRCGHMRSVRFDT